MAGQALSGRVVHIDQPLSNMAINYRMSGFIADMVFPVVPVGKQTDIYIKYDQADIFRREDTKRSRGTEAQKIMYRVSSDSYYAENYALKADVTLEDRSNADPIFVSNFEGGRVRRVMDGLQLDWELRVSSLTMNTANVGSNAAVDSSWADQTNANPITDVDLIINNVQDSTGYRPNRLLFGNKAWRNFRRNDNVKDAVLGAGVGPNITGGGHWASTEEVARMLEVEKILVGGAYHNTAEEGIAQLLENMWPDSVLAYYTPDQPSVDEPSFGYSFRWSAPGLPNMNVERHPFESKTKVDEVEVGYYQAEKVTSAPLGFLLTNVNSNN